MNEQEPDVHDLLVRTSDPVAEHESDVADDVRRGRTRLRRRRSAAVVGSIAAVAVVIGGVAALGPGSRSTTLPAVTPSATRLAKPLIATLTPAPSYGSISSGAPIPVHPLTPTRPTAPATRGSSSSTGVDPLTRLAPQWGAAAHDALDPGGRALVSTSPSLGWDGTSGDNGSAEYQARWVSGRYSGATLRLSVSEFTRPGMDPDAGYHCLAGSFEHATCSGVTMSNGRTAYVSRANGYIGVAYRRTDGYRVEISIDYRGDNGVATRTGPVPSAPTLFVLAQDRRLKFPV